MKRRALRWLLLVAVNTPLAGALALTMSPGPAAVAGMVLGIATWWALLVAIDAALTRRGWHAAVRALRTGATIKAWAQLLFVPDVIAGALVVLVLMPSFPFSGAAPLSPAVQTFAITVGLGGAYLLPIALFAFLRQLSAGPNDGPAPAMSARKLDEVFE